MEQTYTATTDDQGRAQVQIKAPTTLRPWTVAQVSVELPGASPINTTCTMRRNGIFVTSLVASGDAAGGDPPVYLGSGDVLTIEWEGAQPGSNATVLILYSEPQAAR